jgi:hypothetical protein
MREPGWSRQDLHVEGRHRGLWGRGAPGSLPVTGSGTPGNVHGPPEHVLPCTWDRHTTLGTRRVQGGGGRATLVNIQGQKTSVYQPWPSPLTATICPFAMLLADALLLGSMFWEAADNKAAG